MSNDLGNDDTLMVLENEDAGSSPSDVHSMGIFTLIFLGFFAFGGLLTCIIISLNRACQRREEQRKKGKLIEFK